MENELPKKRFLIQHKSVLDQKKLDYIMHRFREQKKVRAKHLLRLCKQPASLMTEILGRRVIPVDHISLKEAILFIKQITSK